MHEKQEHYDLLTAVMICLGNPEAEDCDGILKLLSVLLSSETNVTEKWKVLEQEFEIPMTEKRAVSETQ